MRVDLVDLRLFVNIVEANGIKRGAERSNISTPAASIRMKNLEVAVGSILLKRVTHGVILTEAGSAFLQHARMVLQQFDELHADMRSYARGLKGYVRVSANRIVIDQYLPQALTRYLSQTSDICVSLQERKNPDSVRAVQEGNADIGIFYGPVEVDGLRVLPYRSDRLVVATAPKHPLARRRSVTFAELLNFDFVGFSTANSVYSLLESAAQAQHAPLRIRIHVGSLELQCQMVQANVGIAIFPGSVARRFAKTINIKTIALEGEIAERDLKLCVRDEAQMAPHIVDLLNLLKQEA